MYAYISVVAYAIMKRKDENKEHTSSLVARGDQFTILFIAIMVLVVFYN